MSDLMSDLWTGLKPWALMRFNTISQTWEKIGSYTHRGEAETAAAKMNRACRLPLPFPLFKAVFDQQPIVTQEDNDCDTGLGTGSSSRVDRYRQRFM
jgi:hypothetical protein